MRCAPSLTGQTIDQYSTLSNMPTTCSSHASGSGPLSRVKLPIDGPSPPTMYGVESTNQLVDHVGGVRNT